MKRAFTLIELMLAILLGAMVVMMIAGSLRTAVKAWESVERISATNYNRRTVLDIIKRQTSSLFYAEDAQSMNDQTGVNGAKARPRDRKANRQVHRQEKRKKDVFEMPKGANFFKGEIQQIEFVSTVSFLSDFPGQVTVKYYVIQKDSESEDETPVTIGGSAPPPPPPEQVNEDGEDEMEAEELEGNLYLVMQETNLFLNQTHSSSDYIDEPVDPESDGEDEENDREIDEVSLDDLLDEEPRGTTQVMLLGPLRKFSIRYRIPASRDVNSEDEDEDWETSWDVNAKGGQYPTAVEFTFFYEKPGITDEIDTEDLDGIRMVIPVYSTNNLNQRGSHHGSFFEE